MLCLEFDKWTCVWCAVLRNVGFTFADVFLYASSCVSSAGSTVEQAEEICHFSLYGAVTVQFKEKCVILSALTMSATVFKKRSVQTNFGGGNIHS